MRRKKEKGLGEAGIRLLADHLYKEKMKDGSGVYLCLVGMRDIDMLDILKDEIQQVPESPVSVELKRLLRAKCLEEAKELANRLITAD